MVIISSCEAAFPIFCATNATIGIIIAPKQDSFRKEQSEAQKKLDDTISENQKLQSETTDLRLKNSQLRLEYYENIDKLTDKQKEIEVAQKEADKWMMI